MFYTIKLTSKHGKDPASGRSTSSQTTRVHLVGRFGDRLTFRAPKDPRVALGLYYGLVLVLCVVESWPTHVLEEHLPSEESAPLLPCTGPAQP
jgi:hypothetical protein